MTFGHAKVVPATQNQLAEIGYKHITTSRDIDVPDLAFLRTIERLGPGGSEGDCTVLTALPL